MIRESRLEPTEHGLVPKGDGWFVLNAREAQWLHAPGRWGGYTVDEAARRHGAGVDEPTTDARKAYAGLSRREPTRYRDGWLPRGR